MDLLLWRHAEAEDGIPDLKRKLTPRGEKQAQQMATWLKTHAPENLRIVASPAKRCQQTDQRLSPAPSPRASTSPRNTSRASCTNSLRRCWLSLKAARSPFRTWKSCVVKIFERHFPLGNWRLGSFNHTTLQFACRKKTRLLNLYN
ncbi:MAG: sixA [Proteobacteria bacterium]|nr:sixA [Pseudomonadota bacterium]